jgi:hypothetical protein
MITLSGQRFVGVPGDPSALADLATGHVGVPPTDRWDANGSLVSQTVFGWRQPS